MDLQFDATQVEPNKAFDPLPPGWYFMKVTGAETVNSDSAGQMLKLTHEIDEQKHPEFANRKVWSNLCINHPGSQQARDIAQRTLSGLCHAIGKLRITNTDELLGCEVQVKLKVKQADEKYDAKNEVVGYKATEEAAAPIAVPQTSAAAGKPTATAAPAAAPKAKPWG